MSQGILIFQAIVTIACIAFVLAAGIQKSNRLSKLMLIVAFLCLIENAAYLMEIQADSISAILLIMKLRYIGVAFIDTFFLLFCIRYTQKDTQAPGRCHARSGHSCHDQCMDQSVSFAFLPGHLLCDRRQSDLSAQSLRTGHLF